MIRYSKALLLHSALMLLLHSALIIAILLSAPLSLAFAQSQSIPPYINYQGRLTNQWSGALVNGVKNITFALYDSATGGTPIYSQTQQVNIVNGAFSVYVGKGEGNYQGDKVTDGIPSEVFTEHSARYLGIKIADSSTEMTPRQQIGSVAYAYKAEEAEKARVAESVMGQVTADSTGNVGIGTASPSEKLDVDGNIKSSGTVKATSFEGDGSKLTGVLLRKHSLDAADGDPQDAVYVDSNGNVGIGTTRPGAEGEIFNVHGKAHIGNCSSGVSYNPSKGDTNFTLRLDADEYTSIGFHDGSNTIGNIKFSHNYGFEIGQANGPWGPHNAIMYGNVGIGTNSPSYKLHVAGTAAGTSWTNLSDSRLKKDVTSIDGALDKVSVLRGVEFKWRTEEFPDKGLDEGKKIGLIAQEVEKVLPEVVSTDHEGYKSVEYANIVAVLIEAVKELKTQNEDLRARIQALESSMSH
jgi:hypothetical protein